MNGAGHSPWAERWELYVAGMELANAFSELTNPDEQRRRFAAWNEQRRRLGKPMQALDEAFLAALESIPQSAGVALGVDRLLMSILKLERIGSVLAFDAERA